MLQKLDLNSSCEIACFDSMRDLQPTRLFSSLLTLSAAVGSIRAGKAAHGVRFSRLLPASLLFGILISFLVQIGW